MGSKLSRYLYLTTGLLLSICLVTAAVAQDGQEKALATDASQAKLAAEKRPSDATGTLTGTVKTFFLSNATAPTEMQDIVNTLRVMSEVQRVTLLPAQDAIVVRGTANQIALSEKLVAELDSSRKKFGNQYRIEIRLSELEGGKQTATKKFSVIADPRETAKVRIGSRSTSAKSSETASTDGSQSVEAWQNLECQIRSETEKDVILRVDLDFVNASPRDSPQNPLAPRIQVMDQFRLELGKSTLLAALDVPESRSSFQVEATVTRIKAKP